MSFGWTATTWMAIAVGTQAAVTAYSADQSRKNANQANDQAKAAALKNQQAQDEATNRANGKTPDITAMMAANTLAGKAGASGTMLTGPQGVDPSLLALGKNTPLGS